MGRLAFLLTPERVASAAALRAALDALPEELRDAPDRHHAVWALLAAGAGLPVLPCSAGFGRVPPRDVAARAWVVGDHVIATDDLGDLAPACVQLAILAGAPELELCFTAAPGEPQLALCAVTSREARRNAAATARRAPAAA